MEQGAGKRAGDVPGLQAELWQRLSVAGVRRSGGIPAEQRLGGAESSARRRSQGRLKEGAGDLGVHAWNGRPVEITAEDLGLAVARAEGAGGGRRG